MFEDRSSWIGIGLLVVCGLSAGAMLAYIIAGENISSISLPLWLKIAAGVLGGGLFIWLAVMSLRGQWFGHDLRGRKRRWWRRDTEG